MTVLKTLGYIPESVKLREKVDRKTALNVIEKAVKFINQRDYESEYHSRYISDVKEENEDLKANDLLYKDGGYSFKKIVIIEIISFILQELFLLWLVFNGGGELNSSTYLEDETILGKIKKTILMLYD